MAETCFLSPPQVRQLELLFSYNRIPVRALSEEGEVVYSSFDADAFRRDELPGRFPALFRGTLPAVVCEGSLELIAAFPVRRRRTAGHLVIGPVLLGLPRTPEELSSLSCLPKDGDPQSLVGMLPIVDLREFAGFVRLLYTGFTGKELSLRELFGRNAGLSPAQGIPEALSTSVFNRRENAADRASYAQELFLLSALRSGDPKELERLPELIGTRTGLRLSDDPLRQSIYEFVSIVATLSRFAIEGGLEEELAFDLSEVYIRRADSCRNSLEVTALLYAAVTDFTAQIREASGQRSYSGHIVACTDYIFRHLHDIVSLEDLSEETGLTPAYLSSLFKKETGLSLSAFVQLRRIEEAKNLLRFSDYRIAEISSYLAFSSQSYFTSVFRKHTGTTPKKYRETHYRKSR